MSMGHTNPPKTEPIEGHGGTKYEGIDVQAGTVIGSLAMIAGLVALGFILMFGVQKFLESTHPPGENLSPLAADRVVPPSPQLQVHPWEELPEVRQHEAEILNGSGKDKLGRVHIPITAAMDDVVSRLKVAENAPAGLTTPGGNGREFSHSLSELPSAYRQPQAQIEGEVRKNAQ